MPNLLVINTEFIMSRTQLQNEMSTKAKEIARMNYKKQVVNEMQKKVLAETSDRITIGESEMKNQNNIMAYVVIYHSHSKEDEYDCYARDCRAFDDFDDEIRGVFTNKKSAMEFVKESATDAVDTWSYIGFDKESTARKHDILHQIKHHYTIEPHLIDNPKWFDGRTYKESKQMQNKKPALQALAMK